MLLPTPSPCSKRQVRNRGPFDVVTRVVQSPSTDKVIRGRAWTVLGFAYKQDGQFEQARHCYEQALSIFNESDIFDSDRAAALDYFGNLEVDTGNLADGLRLFTEALQIDERFRDHSAAFYGLHPPGWCSDSA